jgi:hypothetical protein
MLGPQGNPEQRPYARLRRELHLEVTHQRGKYELHLLQRKGRADAGPGTRPEGDVGEATDLLPFLGASDLVRLDRCGIENSLMGRTDSLARVGRVAVENLTLPLSYCPLAGDGTQLECLLAAHVLL